MMVEGPLSPLSPADSTNTNSSASNSTEASDSVGRSHRYKVAMTARARQRRMRRMKEKEEKVEEKVKDVIAPADNGKRQYKSPSPSQKVKYTDRALSASRKRSNSKPRGPPSAPPVASPVTPSSPSKERKQVVKESQPAAAGNTPSKELKTPKRTNSRPTDSASKKNIYVHEIPMSPATPNMYSNFVTPSKPIDNNLNAIEAPTSPVKTNEYAWSEASTPSILQREEIFHHKAAANIVRLLTPDRMFRGAANVDEVKKKFGRNVDGRDELDSSLEFEKNAVGESPTGVVGDLGVDGGSSLEPVKNLEKEWKKSDEQARQIATSPGNAVNASKAKEDTKSESDESVIREALTTRMISPSQQLSDLLSQIHRDTEITRAYATRRKNACGALKVLSAKEENRLKLCWTTGVLSSISSVLNDVNVQNLDELSHNANTEARNRVVSTLIHLSANKKNRMLMCNTLGVLESITKCIAYDEGESRQGCCMVLMQLAKSPDTRAVLIKSPGLLDTLAKVIEVPTTKTVSVKAKGSNEGGLVSRRKNYENPYLKMFESHLSPNALRSPGEESFPSPTMTPHDEGESLYSPEEGTFDDSDTEGRTSPVLAHLMMNGSYLTPQETMSPEESIYSPDDEETESGTDDESVSTDSGSSYSSGSSHSTESHSHSDHTDVSESCSGSETDASRTDDESRSHVTEKSVESHPVVPSLSNKSTEVEEKQVCLVTGQMDQMEICFKSTHGSEEEKEVEEEVEVEDVDYDADPNTFLHGARLNIFGCLICLVKNKEIAYEIARSVPMIQALIQVSKKQASASQARALAVLAHLTRHPQNCHHLIFAYTDLLPMLQQATKSEDTDARKYALCALQNLSMDMGCKTTIAHTPEMIQSLTDRCNGQTSEEVHAAIATLQNLSDEPANLIQFTIVKSCIWTIMAIARSNKWRMNAGIESKMTRFMAQNTLATISYWFQKIATSALLKDVKEGTSKTQVNRLHDAVLQPTEWDQWK